MVAKKLLEVLSCSKDSISHDPAMIIVRREVLIA